MSPPFIRIRLLDIVTLMLTCYPGPVGDCCCYPWSPGCVYSLFSISFRRGNDRIPFESLCRGRKYESSIFHLPIVRCSRDQLIQWTIPPANTPPTSCWVFSSCCCNKRSQAFLLSSCVFALSLFGIRRLRKKPKRCLYCRSRLSLGILD